MRSQPVAYPAFWYMGARGQDPQNNVKTEKRLTYKNDVTYARASASETYISGLKILIVIYICTHNYTINACSSLLLLVVRRFKRQYTDKTLTLRKSMYTRASFKIFAFSHSKTAINYLSMFCWNFRYFVGTK